MNKKKIYVTGSCAALLVSFLVNHLLTCVLIFVALMFIPMNNRGGSVDDYYAMKYQECSLDDFEDEVFYKVFCKAFFIFVTTFVYTMCTL